MVLGIQFVVVYLNEVLPPTTTTTITIDLNKVLTLLPNFISRFASPIIELNALSKPFEPGHW